MKKMFWVSLIAVVIGALGLMTLYAHQTGSGMMGQGYGSRQQGDWNYCPYCGNYVGPGSGYGMMGPGMMGGYQGGGYGMMGPGMMGPGYGYRQPYQQRQEPLDGQDVKRILENYLQSTRNPNLKLGKIEDKDRYFEAEIVTKEGSLVDKVTVDKMTGWVQSMY